jgi:hypothetical protein
LLAINRDIFSNKNVNQLSQKESFFVFRTTIPEYFKKQKGGMYGNEKMWRKLQKMQGSKERKSDTEGGVFPEFQMFRRKENFRKKTAKRRNGSSIEQKQAEGGVNFHLFCLPKK